MIAGANSPGHHVTLNGQTVGGAYIAGAHGSTTAGPMWGDAMKAIEKYLPDETFHDAEPADHRRGRASRSPRSTARAPDAAAAALRKAGFTPVVGPTVDSGNPAGTVAYLSPGSGSQVGDRQHRDDLRLRRHAVRRPAAQAPSPRRSPAAGTPATGKPSPGKRAAASPARKPRTDEARTDEGPRPGADSRGGPGAPRRVHPAAQPSWRRTSAATAPPSARPLTWGCSAPITLPIARMPSGAARASAIAAATSSPISASSSCSGR